MRKIEAFVDPSLLESLREALVSIGVSGMTAAEVMGAGEDKSHTEWYRSAGFEVPSTPQIKLEIAVPDDLAGAVVRRLALVAGRGRHAGGTVLVSRLDDVVRIRTGERGEAAV